MNGTEFVRRAKRYARRHNLAFRFVSRRGKGSHGTVYLGSRTVVVKRWELSKGLLNSMLKSLDIQKERF